MNGILCIQLCATNREDYVMNLSERCLIRKQHCFSLSVGWAHVVCALYIPEVRFGNVTTMEPIKMSSVPHERFLKVILMQPVFKFNILAYILSTIFNVLCK